ERPREGRGGERLREEALRVGPEHARRERGGEEERVRELRAAERGAEEPRDRERARRRRRERREARARVRLGRERARGDVEGRDEERDARPVGRVGRPAIGAAVAAEELLAAVELRDGERAALDEALRLEVDLELVGRAPGPAARGREVERLRDQEDRERRAHGAKLAA